MLLSKFLVLCIWAATRETVPYGKCAKQRLLSSAVWSESSLSARRNVAHLAIQNVPSEESSLDVHVQTYVY